MPNDNRVIEYIQKFFESSNINFLIGAGSSYGAINVLGDLEDRLTMLKRDYEGNPNEQIRKQIIELINGFIQSVCVPNQDLLKGTDKDIIKQILTRNKEFMVTIYNLLLFRASNRLPKKINIFTTNYDLFFEMALEELGVPYNDGGVGVFNRYFSTKNFQKRTFRLSDSYSHQYEEPVINIIKLHGSINWMLTDDNIVIRNEISIKSVDEYCIDETSFIKSDVNMPIVLPTKQKFVRTLMEHMYYDLSRLYSNELERDQSVLFVFGFSFKDEHYRSITLRALGNPSLTLVVFPYSFEDEQFALKTFQTHSNVKIIRVSESGEGDKKTYMFNFATEAMSPSNRVNIDYKFLINTFRSILHNVSEGQMSK